MKHIYQFQIKLTRNFQVEAESKEKAKKVLQEADDLSQYALNEPPLSHQLNQGKVEFEYIEPPVPEQPRKGH